MVRHVHSTRAWVEFSVRWCRTMVADLSLLGTRSQWKKRTVGEPTVSMLLVMWQGSNTFVEKSGPAGHLWSQEGAVFVGQCQHFRVRNMCGKFTICGHCECCQMSDNIFIRAVCGKESSVMFIEGVPHCLVWLFVLSGDWICRSTTDWYLQPAGGNLFCIAKASQVTMATMPPKLYCAFVRSLVFAGRQLEKGRQTERQSSQQWRRQSLWLFSVIEAGSCRTTCFDWI